jgi:hypothetical protein
MNRSGSSVTMALLLAMPFLALTAQDQQDRHLAKDKKEKNLKKKSDCRLFQLSEIKLPPIEIDLRALEMSLDGVERSLASLESMDLPDLAFAMPELPEIEIPAIEIPPLNIPPFSVEIPPVEIPEVEVGDVSFDCDVEAHHIFQYLGDEEQVRLQALRSLACRGADQAIEAYQQNQRPKSSPAMRYEAVRLLGHFLDDERVLTYVADAAKSDKNLQVRKKAIALLGKSRDPRSAKALQEILMN